MACYVLSEGPTSQENLLICKSLGDGGLSWAGSSDGGAQTEGGNLMAAGGLIPL